MPRREFSCRHSITDSTVLVSPKREFSAPQYTSHRSSDAGEREFLADNHFNSLISFILHIHSAFHSIPTHSIFYYSPKTVSSAAECRYCAQTLLPMYAADRSSHEILADISIRFASEYRSLPICISNKFPNRWIYMNVSLNLANILSLAQISLAKDHE